MCETTKTIINNFKNNNKNKKAIHNCVRKLNRYNIGRFIYRGAIMLQKAIK